METNDLTIISKIFLQFTRVFYYSFVYYLLGIPEVHDVQPLAHGYTIRYILIE